MAMGELIEENCAEVSPHGMTVGKLRHGVWGSGFAWLAPSVLY